MSGDGDNPIRQFVAAWAAVTGVVAEWAEQTAAVTSESYHKLATDPAVRALLETLRGAVVWWRACACPCATAHPDDVGICDHNAVITRRITDVDGDVEVPLCAPCAVAQGVAEMPGNPGSGG